MRALLVLLLLTACTDRRGAPDEERPPGPVSVLLVIDDSNSMADLQAAVASDAGPLLSALTDSERSFTLGVTTTDLDGSGNGRGGGIRSLSPIGGTPCAPHFLDHNDQDVALATDFAELVNVGVTGTGQELGVRAAALALCMAQDEAFWLDLIERDPDDRVRRLCEAVPPDMRTCNEGFLRDDGDVAILLITDEGGDDFRDPGFASFDYVDAMQELAGDLVFHIAGPTHRGPEEPLTCGDHEITFEAACNPFGSAVGAIEFLEDVACGTSGLYSASIAPDSTDACDVADLEPAFSDFADAF